MRLQKLHNPFCDKKDALSKKSSFVSSSAESNSHVGEIFITNTTAATEPFSLCCPFPLM